MWVAEYGIQICGVIGTILTLLTSYKFVFWVVGLFQYKKYPKAKQPHTYAVCVPARNEERVIKNFLDSVAYSDYPLEKLTVFVIADNCTDNTAAVARAYRENGLNVVVYERQNPEEKTKGFALKYLFEKIGEGYGREAFEGYFIFDADNVVSEDYFTKMNEAFDAGNKIITSFRNSKNANQNWIANSYAMHWLRTCLTENRAKGVLNMACRVQGTGFLFANELVKDGWIYTSFTEDRSFCSDAVLKNYKITYCDEAVFYDEQPYSLSVAFRQRIRWAKGHLQSTVENCPKLLKKCFGRKNTFTAYDCFWLNFPTPLESGVRKLLKICFQIAIAVAGGVLFGWWQGILLSYLVAAAQRWGKGILDQFCILLVYRKRLEKTTWWKRLLFLFTFPLFDVIGKWATYIAVFKKVEWKAIPHNTVVDLEKLKKK